MKISERAAIPRTVWMLGFVSLFMDLSSEMVHSLLPVFLVSSLGASVLTVGLIEGASEAVTFVAKVFSGALSDFFRRRKALILLGYGMAALTKPLFPLATSVGTVFLARFLDRIGKGIRKSAASAPLPAGMHSNNSPVPIGGSSPSEQFLRLRDSVRRFLFCAQSKQA